MLMMLMMIMIIIIDYGYYCYCILLLLLLRDGNCIDCRLLVSFWCHCSEDLYSYTIVERGEAQTSPTPGVGLKASRSAKSF